MEIFSICAQGPGYHQPTLSVLNAKHEMKIINHFPCKANKKWKEIWINSEIQLTVISLHNRNPFLCAYFRIDENPWRTNNGTSIMEELTSRQYPKTRMSSPVVSQINKDSSEDPCPWRIPGKVNQSKNKTICNKLLIWSSISFGSKFVMRVKPLWLNYLCALDTCSGCEPNHKRKGRQPGFGNITNKDFNSSLLNRTIRYHQQGRTFFY